MKGPELNIEFCAYYNDKKEKFDEGGLYPFLEYCQSSKPKDVVVRVDYEMGFDEIDIYCESLAISKLSYEKIDDGKFVAKFACDSKSGKPLMKVIYALGEAGNGGHSYGFTVGKEKFYFDGDGADRIMKINGIKFSKIKNAYDLGKVWNDTTRKNNEENTDNDMAVNIEEIVSKTLKNCVNEIKKQGLNEFARPSNGFRYMLQQVSKRLCYMIRNFIDNCENLNKPYTRGDIRKYMERPFMKNKEKYPSLPDNTLDKCIDFVLDNGRGDFFMLRESHGSKKHNAPKDALAAMRKGNREADQEIFGGGFRQTKKVHKAKNDYDRKNNKVDLDKLDRYDESVKKINYNDLLSIISESVAKHIKMLKEDFDSDNDYEDEFTGYFIDKEFYLPEGNRMVGDMGHTFQDMWEGKCNTQEEAEESVRSWLTSQEGIDDDMSYFNEGNNGIPVHIVVRCEEGHIVEQLSAFICEEFSEYANAIQQKINVKLNVI